MLDWSISLFRIRGIALTIHVSFFFLIGYAAWTGWNTGESGSWPGVAWSVGYVILVFMCVVLHELGHAFVARSYGVQVPRILLLPVGGMAEFDRIPRNPGQEIAIALAGPIVNALLVLALAACVPWPTITALTDFELSAKSLLQHLLVLNLAMGCFNLVPVFPMDGGRVLRAILARRTSYVRATQCAAATGKLLSAFAIILAFAGMFITHLWAEGVLMVLLFSFIFWAGEAEYRHVKSEEHDAHYWRRRFAAQAVSRERPPSSPTPS